MPYSFSLCYCFCCYCYCCCSTLCFFYLTLCALLFLKRMNEHPQFFCLLLLLLFIFKSLCFDEYFFLPSAFRHLEQACKKNIVKEYQPWGQKNIHISFSFIFYVNFASFSINLSIISLAHYVICICVSFSFVSF